MKTSRVLVPVVAALAIAVGCTNPMAVLFNQPTEGVVEWSISDLGGDILAEGGGPASFRPYGSASSGFGKTNNWVFSPTGAWLGDPGPWQLGIVVHPGEHCPHITISMCWSDEYFDSHSATLTTAAASYVLADDVTGDGYHLDGPSEDPSCLGGQRTWMTTSRMYSVELGGYVTIRWGWCSPVGGG